MPYEVKLNADDQIIDLTYSGIVTPSELKTAFDEALLISLQNGIQTFFADCTTMVGGHSVIDLYFLISLYESCGLPRGSKEALLLPSLKSSAEEVKFYETACLNQGYNIKIFTDSNEAFTWLKSA